MEKKNIIKNKMIFDSPSDYLGKELRLEGWIRTNRHSGNLAFIEFNDGTSFKSIQIVYDQELQNFKEVSKFLVASGIAVEGVLVSSEGAKQDFEIKATKIELLAHSDNDYPLQKKRHSFEYLRTIGHLRPRANAFMAVFRLRSIAAQAIHDFFSKENFVYVNTPIITGSDCEGAGEMFRVTNLDLEKLKNIKDEIDYKHDFFGKETFLTVSGQLAAEPFALAFRNVYTFGPTFRAENSNTSRHISEFWMMEPEMAFCDLEGNMNLATKMLKYICKYILEKAPDEIDFFDLRIKKGLRERIEKMIASDFLKITYTEAIDILLKSKKKFQYKVEWGVDLQSEHERYLCEEHFSSPLYITDYPKDIKAFYMRLNDDNKTVAACDLLVPGIGEIIGGSQREERYDLLEKRIIEMQGSTKGYEWYLDTRKYGGVYHSGFGLGFERFLMYVTGMENIRDVIPYPRSPKSAEF